MNRINGSDAIREFKLIISMILCQVASGGVSLFYKLAAAHGMKIDILVAYRYIFATSFILPFAILKERNIRPRFTWMIAFQGVACGVFGATLGSNLYAESLVLTSATYVTAMTNIIPALTLIMAIIFRLERIDIRRSSTGRAKVIGTTLSIVGAMVLTLYKGINITMWSTNINLLMDSDAKSRMKPHNHILGSLIAFCSCLSYTIWLLIQTKMTRNYPTYSSTALLCFSGAIMSVVYALCKEKANLADWKLGWNIRLLASAYTGIVGSGLAFALITWGTKVKGPLFVSAFTPSALIFVAVLGSLILDEKLNMGSIIGSVLIIMGLYIVIWGKSKEMKMVGKERGEISLSTRNQTVNTSMVADCTREREQVTSPHSHVHDTSEAIQRC